MTRDQLEHILRASSEISNEYEFVIVGSQSILGEYPNAPGIFLRSMEADVYPLQDPDKWELIDGAIGEQSQFHEEFGYYAQGISPTTSVLPNGWEKRLTRIEGEKSVGYCISVQDLALSKLVASREKDLEFVKALLKHKMVYSSSLEELAKDLPADPSDPRRVERIVNTLGRLENDLVSERSRGRDLG